MKKSEKKKADAYRQQVKEAEERMKNPTPEMIRNLENYCLYQILYINDAACNAVKFLESDLAKIPYKGKGARTIYNAAMKRVNAYFELINVCGIDMNSIANLFGEMDGYIDPKVTNLTKAIEDVLTSHNVDNAHWIAKVETASILCEYAVKIGKDYVDRIEKINPKNGKILNKLLIAEISKVVYSLSEFVITVSNCRTEIDLNNEQSVVKAYSKFSKDFITPKNFLEAVTEADEMNAEEGNMRLM